MPDGPGESADPQHGGDAPIAVCRIGPGDLRRIRQLMDRLARQRVGPDRSRDLVLAVDEVATNVLRHGGGFGWLRVWDDEGSLVCEVVDHGPGLPDLDVGRARPDPMAGDRCGMWLARTLSSDVEVRSAPGSGTTVRLRFDAC